MADLLTDIVSLFQTLYVPDPNPTPEVQIMREMVERILPAPDHYQPEPEVGFSAPWPLGCQQRSFPTPYYFEADAENNDGKITLDGSSHPDGSTSGDTDVATDQDIADHDALPDGTSYEVSPPDMTVAETDGTIQPDIEKDLTPIDVPTTPKFCESQVSLPASCNITSIAAGQTSTFLAMKDGSVQGWGKISGTIFSNPADLFSSPTPQKISGLQKIIQVSIRSQHLLASDTYGQVWAMGQNGYGQLGNGQSLKTAGINVDSATPFVVPNLANIMSVATGAFHSLALDTSGNIYAWGNNSKGQLGLQDPNNSGASVANEVTQPTAILFKQVDTVTSMGAGSLHSYAVQQSGSGFTWGDNAQNELGIAGAGAAIFAPTFIDKGFLKFAGGDSFTCFLTTGCGFSCKGDGAPTNAATKTLSSVSDIVAGGDSMVAITESGDAYVWGNNAFTQITGLGKIAMASVGEDHTCLVTTGCEIYCTGVNQSGQLGDGSTTDSSTWVKVNGLP